MNKNVPFISKNEIERDVERLLGEFMLARRVSLEAPIPIEDIV